MHASLFSVAAIVAGFASAKECMNITVPVSLQSRNAVFGNMKTPYTALDATTFAQNQTRQGANFTQQALTGYNTIHGDYNISAQFCTPSGTNGTLKNPTVQVLTHGIGFDKTYWDLSYSNFNYSYVDVATDRYGYCTLSYDRLGIGNSSHGEPRDEIQANLEIAGLAAMTNMLRNGTFPMVKHSFDKVLHVGHSFGSAQTYGLVAMYPEISDGIVLTGFSMNSSFVGYFTAGNDLVQANLNQPLRFGNSSTMTSITQALQDLSLTDVFAYPNPNANQGLNYPRGYLVNSNVNALQYLFLYPGYFDTEIAYAGEQTKQPVTVGEILSLAPATMMNPYKGPVLVVTGSNDLPYCGGDCLNTGGSAPSVISSVAKNFPMTNVSTVIQPNTGHGINFHYNATGAYNVINSFFNSHGLTSN